MFVVNNLILGGLLTQHGIHPRHISSLPGIIWSPFLHVSFRHLVANTVPLLILGGIICARSKTEFIAVTAGGISIGGGLTWLLARNADHVGASGLIFCYFGFLISRAWFDRTFVTFCLSVICMVAYGGIIMGLLRMSPGISWESHLTGLVAGVADAWMITKKGPDKIPNNLAPSNKAG
jgi:membrane associated rhomboid family serine protease